MQAKQFSALLVEDNVVPRHKVEEAYQRQVLFGGRLGTNLLEIGAIDEETLLTYLSKASELPWAYRELFLGPERAAVDLLGLSAIREHHLILVGFEGDVAQAVVTDPVGELALAALTRAIGRPIAQYITSEFRFCSLLEQFHAVPLDKRYRQLNERFPVAQAPARAPGELDSRAFAGVDGLDDLRLAPPSAAPQAPVASPEARAERTKALYAEFRSATRTAKSRDQVLRLFADFGAGVGQRCVLLRLAKDRLRGYAVAGGGQSIDARVLDIHLGEHGDIPSLCSGESYYHGPPEAPELVDLYDALGGPLPAECIVLPIQLVGRVAMLAVIDNGDEWLDEDPTPLFKAVYRVSAALERLLRTLKGEDVDEPSISRPSSIARMPEQFAVRDEPHARGADVVSPADDAFLAEAEAPPTESNPIVQAPEPSWDVASAPPQVALPPDRNAQTNPLGAASRSARDERPPEPQRYLTPVPTSSPSASDVQLVPLSPDASFERGTVNTLVELVALEPEAYGGGSTRHGMGSGGGEEQASDLLEIDIEPLSVVDDADEDELEELALIDDIEVVTGDEALVEAAPPVFVRAATRELSMTELEALPPDRDLDAWAARLDDRDPEVAARAVGILSHPHPMAVRALMDCFPGRLRLYRFDYDKDMPPAPRHSRVLSSLVSQGELAVSPLVGLLGSTSADERFYALLVLIEMRAERLGTELWELFFDRDPQVRVAAVRAFKARARMEDFSGTVQQLCEEAATGDERRAVVALKILSELRMVETLPMVIPLIEHGNRRIGEAALAALRAVALDDPGASLRKWERWVTTDEQKTRVQRIADAMVHKERQIRMHAAEELAEFPGMLINYHPDAHRRERQRARASFLEWVQGHPELANRSSVFSGMGDTRRGHGRHEAE